MIFNIKKIINGKWKENCYIVSNKNKDAIIIDPGSDEKLIIGFIQDKNLNVHAILNTHAHFDHIGAVNKIKEELSIPFYLHSKDEKLLKSANLYVKLFDGLKPIKIPAVNYYFDQIDIHDHITVFPIKILFTPGHTGGSVCILIKNLLFTGDTLFNGKIGRIDLPGGDKQKLFESLKIISKLPHHLKICPGHGKTSSILNELKYNKSFIQAVQWA